MGRCVRLQTQTRYERPPSERNRMGTAQRGKDGERCAVDGNIPAQHSRRWFGARGLSGVAAARCDRTQNPPRFGCHRCEYRGQHHLLLHTQSADVLFQNDVEGAEEESAQEDDGRAQDVQGTEAQTAQKGVEAEEFGAGVGADVKWKRIERKSRLSETFVVDKEKKGEMPMAETTKAEVI